MFDNIDEKIKKLAKFCAYLCLISGIIILFISIVEFHQISFQWDFEYAFERIQKNIWGIIISAVGYFNSWLLYGFGELITKVSAIEKATRIKTETENNKEVLDA